MNNTQAQEARMRLKDAVQFKRKGSGYWFPDRIIDRFTFALLGVTYHPKRKEDEVLAQFCDVPVQFNYSVDELAEREELA
jgi:hypothetical protein